MSFVLLVDDSAMIINEVSSFLHTQGIECHVARNGLEGFQILQARSDIALALVDVNMPVMDGLSMIEKVRQELPECNSRFIMLTTEFDRQLKEHGKALGVKGWIIKPFRGEHAISAIRKFLQHE